jgi:KDO2-lipid IV(A) lauroyltransferase
MSRLLREFCWLLEWLLAMPVFVCIRAMSEPAVTRAARRAGQIAYWLLARDRRWCLLNLRLAFGENLDECRRRHLAQAVFAHHALTFCEILRLTPEWLERKVVVEGLEHVRPMLESRRGVIVVSGHLGNFEILSCLATRLGVRNAMLTRPLDNPYFERFLAARRTRYGTRTIAKRGPGIRDAIERLRAGEWIGMAIDQNTVRGGVFVNFLGIPASVPRAAAAIALRENLPVSLWITYRQPDGTHRVVIGPLIELSCTGDKERDVTANTERFLAALEPYILAWPDQYHWQHGCWRTRPDGSMWRSIDRFKDLVEQRRNSPYVPSLPAALFARTGPQTSRCAP